ncbi:hypothetical protein L195_g026797 [Trifolium pratense]|uniref:Uncharacterized protein n=1 Tax=Trifolium pratense TaxID=57577 RepID=A0A2K3NKA3_TRIPR|nr:hypothetical protein L195_g026797 [Trifolium pratense]
MCQNEYNMSNERTSKPTGMLQLDKDTAYQKEIDLLKRKLEKATLGAEESLTNSMPNSWDDLVHTQAGVIKILGGIKTLLKEHSRPNSHENHHLWKRHSTNSSR